ncbi:MAG: cheA2 [Herbinix sp.]|jgi:two-component system chemotaxis sensor kinase CheA|nr:cheA2 [Herbinix sp.]
MTNQNSNESMLDIYLFETFQMIEQLEKVILGIEKDSLFSPDTINEIFRIMHTIKGSSAMMMFQNITELAHAMEDLFYYLREEAPQIVDYTTMIDLSLEGIDFIRIEAEKIKNGLSPDGDAAVQISQFHALLHVLQGGEDNCSAPEENKKVLEQLYQQPVQIDEEGSLDSYTALVFFDEGCQMEHIRAFSILYKMREFSSVCYSIPEEKRLTDEESADFIRQQGFWLYFKTSLDYDSVSEFFYNTIFLRSLKLEAADPEKLSNEEALPKPQPVKELAYTVGGAGKGSEQLEVAAAPAKTQSIISINLDKLDALMDLVGEMVIAKSMVIQNPDLEGLEIENFNKAASQLNKITNEIQDMVMSIRMIPLTATFQKMNRIVRDMCKKLGKEVQLEIIGEETEVDKNIIEHLSDPLMHLVRNALDHGIETPDERLAKGKAANGTITLEAKNAGSDVVITVKDDGRGLDKNKIYRKAFDHGLISSKIEDCSDKELFRLILRPGFSTNENVTEYSGRGVGMDVVANNIDTIGGVLTVDSAEGEGTVFTIKIPLTLAIIDGMNIGIGGSCFTLPVTSVKETFRPEMKDIIRDPDGNVMIMVRGECYPLIRLYEVYNIKTEITDICNGIVLMLEQNERIVCILADELLGMQQVVVKALPRYIQSLRRSRNIAGCTLLGDGSISLIIDIEGLISSSISC